MVTLVAVTALVGIWVGRLAGRRQAFAWLGALVGLFFFLCFSSESLLRGSEFFISDERFYLEEGRAANLSTPSDRYLWILMNALVLRFDWSMGGVPTKLLSLPLLALLVTLLWRIFNRHRLIWAVPLVLPYVAYTATFNLRDTAILATTAACVYYLDSRREVLRLLFFPCFLALYLMRPAAALASGAIWVAILAISSLGRMARGRVAGRSVVVVGGGLVLAGALFAGPVVDRAARSVVWYGYAMGEGFEERALGRGLEAEYVSGSWVTRSLVGVARYTLAPIPTSLLARIAAGGSDQWGVFDDLVRLGHQAVYYVILAFVLVRWRYWRRALRELTRGQVMLLTGLLLYLPVYAIYHFGLSHQRVKIPFQIAVYLFAVVLHRTRKRYGTDRRSHGAENQGAGVRRQGAEGGSVADAVRLQGHGPGVAGIE